MVPEGTAKLIAGIAGIDFASPVSVNDLCAQVKNFTVEADENGKKMLHVIKPLGTAFTIRLENETEWIDPTPIYVVELVGGHPVHAPKPHYA